MPSPRLCEFALMRKPKWQPTMRDQHAERHAFAKPDPQVRDRHHARQRTEEITHVDAQHDFAASAPPASATMLVHITSSGIAMPSASTRGRISRKPCGMPITRIASSSSVTRITPICAVIAEPGAAGHQNRRQHRPEFANHRQAQNIDDVLVRAEEPQLLRGQIAQHDADQERDQRGDGQRLGAGVIDVGRDFRPRRDLRIARDRRSGRARRAPNIAMPPYRCSKKENSTRPRRVNGSNCTTGSGDSRTESSKAMRLKMSRWVSFSSTSCGGNLWPQTRHSAWPPTWSMRSMRDRSQCIPSAPISDADGARPCRWRGRARARAPSTGRRAGRSCLGCLPRLRGRAECRSSRIAGIGLSDQGPL